MWLEVCKNDREISIFLLPFPSNDHGAFKNGAEQNAFYREFTSKHLIPILNEINDK